MENIKSSYFEDYSFLTAVCKPSYRDCLLWWYF